MNVFVWLLLGAMLMIQQESTGGAEQFHLLSKRDTYGEIADQSMPRRVAELPGRPLLVRNAKALQLKDGQELSRSKKTGDSDTLQQYLVRVQRRARFLVRGKLEDMTADVGGAQYLPHDTYRVLFHPAKVEELRQVEGVLGVYTVPREMKLSSSVASLVQGRQKLDSSQRSAEKGHGMTSTIITAIVGKRLRTLPDTSMLAEAWSHMMPREVWSSVQSIHAGSRRKIEITVEGAQVSQLVTWLAEQPDTVHIERSQPKRLANSHAIPTVLSGHEMSGNSDKLRIWERGLQGQGEIIGIADTGLDHDHCMFKDANVAVTSCVASSCTSASVNLNHRKVVSYRTWDSHQVGDVFEGHGTHVAGSAAGDASSYSGNNGVAPKAKIAIDKFEVSNDVLVGFPSDLNSGLFPYAYEVGARIHSNSWGEYRNGEYSSTDQEVDTFVHEHPDFLVIAAAGNFENGIGRSNVWSPASAKNLIAVGATENGADSYVLRKTVDIFFSEIYADGTKELWGEVSAAAFGGAVLASDPLQGDAVLIQPNDACSPITNAGEVSGKIAVVWRGDCYFEDKARAVQLANATGMIVINNEPGSNLVVMSAPEDSTGGVFIPCVFTSKVYGQSLLNSVLAGTVKVEFPSLEYEYGIDVVADFSNYGHTWDGRIKPDILAPGDQIMSARSDGDLASNQCGFLPEDELFLTTQGTSMAAPMVAGAAAIIRQYFRQGYHHGWDPEISPSASLLKAMILNSGQKLQKGFLDNLEGKSTFEDIANFPLPSPVQAHGRISLAKVLKEGNDDKNFNVEVWDSVQVSDGQKVAFCVNVLASASSGLKATLVWSDPPADLTSYSNLVNNLDMVLFDSNGNAHYGNNLTTWDEKNGVYVVPDEINNSEQIFLLDSPPGSYQIWIYGKDIPHSPQNFSLVVTGDFVVSSTCSVIPPCANDCMSHATRGTCDSSSQCICAREYRGVDCSLDNVKLEPAQEYRSQIPARGWQYFFFDLEANERWRLDVLSNERDSDPDLLAAWNRMPTPTDFDFVDFRGPAQQQMYPNSDWPALQPRSEAGYWVFALYAYCCSETLDGPQNVDVSLTLHTEFSQEPVLGPDQIPADDGQDIDSKDPVAQTTLLPPEETEIPDTTSEPAEADASAPATTPSPAAFISFAIMMSMSAAEFESRKIEYMEGVAATAGVDLEKVRILKIEEISDGRREMSAHARALLQTKVQIYTAIEGDQSQVQTLTQALTQDNLNQELSAKGFPAVTLSVKAEVVEDLDESTPDDFTTFQSPSRQEATERGAATELIVIMVGLGGGTVTLGVLGAAWGRYRKRRSCCRGSNVRGETVYVTRPAVPEPTAPVWTGDDTLQSGIEMVSTVTVPLQPVNSQSIPLAISREDSSQRLQVARSAGTGGPIPVRGLLFGPGRTLQITQIAEEPSAPPINEVRWDA